MNSEAFPHPGLRRRLAEIGLPPERHCMRELLRVLPAELDGRPFDEMTADAIAEVLIYLVGKKVLSLPPAAALARDLEWGEQRCQAYGSHPALLELVIPYFAEGLKRNERCLWVAPAALASQIARQEDHRLRDLRNAGDQLEIIDCADWSPEACRREESRALSQGYNGLRLSGDAMHGAAGSLRIKVLCTHPANPFSG